MAYIKIIEPEEAQGELKEIYDDLKMLQGSRLAEINGVFSLEPKLLKSRLLTSSAAGGVYGTTDFDSVKAELIALTVSAINECRY